MELGMVHPKLEVGALRADGEGKAHRFGGSGGLFVGVLFIRGSLAVRILAVGEIPLVQVVQLPKDGYSTRARYRSLVLSLEDGATGHIGFGFDGQKGKRKLKYSALMRRV
jgi:hypothetical protein